MDPALELNIKHAQFQRIIWGACLQNDPPSLDPCKYGWEKEEGTKTLQPIMIPKGTEAAPDEVLRSTKCNC